MELKKSIFRFKNFNCMHGMGSMKIGVDAVLLGAWADIAYAHTILDVGTGCGVIALICAQRNLQSDIDAIDVDDKSIEEANENFMQSQWCRRLRAFKMDYLKLEEKKYDVIISNPPYFNSGIEHPDTTRLIARHEDGLSPKSLLEKGKRLITENGRIIMVIPFDRKDEIMDFAESLGFRTRRICSVRGNPTAKFKRTLIEFSFEHGKIPQIEELTLELSAGHPTPEYKEICKDLYLAF